MRELWSCVCDSLHRQDAQSGVENGNRGATRDCGQLVFSVQYSSLVVIESLLICERACDV